MKVNVSAVQSTVTSPPFRSCEATAAPAPDQRAYRMSSLDMLRGLVIVVMALDHVRDFFMTAAVQDPTADPNTGPLLFATRWITHFCAPTFVFLAGTSAGLMASRKSSTEIATFLLTRGLWLIVLEVLVISTGATFAPTGVDAFGGRTYVNLQVIWVIGASMVLLAAAQFLGRRACLVIGAAIVLGHNLLDPIWPAAMTSASTAPVWAALHSRQFYDVGAFAIYFNYPLLPWVGVMFLGYGAAGLFELPAKQRDERLLRIGLSLVVAFVLFRVVNVYGDPKPWVTDPGNAAASVMSFLGTTKYPPSLLFVLMTLGPAAILCAFADRFSGPLKDALVTLGRAPLAFYIAHIYLIHALAVGLGVAQGFAAEQFLTPYRFFPKGFGVGLPTIYAIWILVVATLYPLCRWVATLKARRQDWWLSYV